ncbi:MAG: hypothetical protein Q9164_001666 [Protoblastenia rupestris]
MDTALEGLNAAQRAAVTSAADVLQVLAPPGSGKTKTLTTRIAHLLQHYQYKPWNIICLTFTIKSSREMRERVARLLSNAIGSRLILGTFHSVCRRYLVTYGHLIGIRKDFGIADTSDTISIIKRLIKRHRLNIDPKRAQARISQSKSKGSGHAKFANEQIKNKNLEQQEFATVFEGYEDQLARSNLLDYDDLLLRCVDLLRSHPSCVSNIEAVLIDEFQDTNVVQFDLMRLFAAQNKRITTVGDPDQSIYGWRSAEIKNLQKMQRCYPDTLIIHLEDNYRSSGAILLSAREVIEQDESRPQKPLLPTHCPGTVPVLRRLPSAETEAAWVIAEIRRTKALTGGLLNYSDYAILLRSASLSRLLETAMGKAGIPYRMVGGRRFYDRAEIKTLLDYLRVVIQPHNNDAVSRIINLPSRGIGPDTVKKLLEEAEVKQTPFWQLIREIVHGHVKTATKISKAAENGLSSFTNIVITVRIKMLDSANPASPEELLRYIIKKLNFKDYLQKIHIEDHEARWANVEELVAQASEYLVTSTVEEGRERSLQEDDTLPTIDDLSQERGKAAEEALSRFLANVALATELQREEEEVEEGKPQSQVTISTIHAAKGLEWPVVFIPSAYDGCIPHSRAEDTDEERRLLYVAMTRAQALLYLSCPTKNSQREDATLSPFLSDKKVQRLISNRGPTINSSEIVDMARILRRDFSPKAALCETLGGLQSREDDQWPLSGEESAEATRIRWNKWEQGREAAGHQSKRRRIESDTHTAVGKAQTTVGVGIITTMQSASSFTCNGLAGFTTAAAQMQQVKELETPARKEGKGLKKDRPSKVPPEHGSLLKLWGVNKEPGNCVGRSAALSAHDGTPTAAEEGSEIGKAIDFTIISTHEKCGPSSVLPVSLAGHRLRTTCSNSRPHRIPTDGNVASMRYVFLSSSPPPAEDPSEGLREEQQPLAQEGLQFKIADSQMNKQDSGPAKTFHTTTVSQLQQRSRTPKKTLGVQRSMNGWPGTARQAFSVPRMTSVQR